MSSVSYLLRWKQKQRLVLSIFCAGTLGLATLVGLTGTTTFKRVTTADIESLAIGLFGVSLLIERTVAIGVTLLATPLSVRRAAVRVHRAASRVESGYESRGEPDPRVIKDEALEEIENEALFNLLVTMAAFTLALLLGSAGISSLSTFANQPETWQRVPFRALDGLLTAGTIAGGSRGIHTMAMALIGLLRAFGSQTRARSSTNGAIGEGRSESPTKTRKPLRSKPRQ